MGSIVSKIKRVIHEYRVIAVLKEMAIELGGKERVEAELKKPDPVEPRRKRVNG